MSSCKLRNVPARNVVKSFRPNTVYHVYNRGVEKRQIFMDDQDYRTFLFCLKLYVSPSAILKNDRASKVNKGSTLLKVEPYIRAELSLKDEIELLSFNLQPNHFHLQIKQKTRSAMTKLLQRACTRYSNYFNQRHNRVGRLFQGVYQAIVLDKSVDILYTSYYIHLNDWFERDEDKRLFVKKGFSFKKLFSSLKNSYSSLPYFLNKAKADWVKPQEILNLLGNTSYQEFLKRKLKDFDEVLTGKVLEE